MGGRGRREREDRLALTDPWYRRSVAAYECLSCSRRTLLVVFAGLAASACEPGLSRVSAAELLAFYEAGDLAGVESLLPRDRRVVLTDVVFHDWAYPDPRRLDTSQGQPDRWREVTRRDDEGGPVYHGVKLRIGAVDPGRLHHSGPKVIAFLPYAAERDVALLKRAYVEGFSLACTVSWLGVLRSGTWDDVQVKEDDMVALLLHGVERP